MPRSLESYRGARRNQARDTKVKFPWSNSILKPGPTILARPNKRDRSSKADERRAKHVTMEFTGFNGLIRSLIQYTIKTIFPGKPKRGWAAKHRKAPFRHYFADHPDRMKIAIERHIHPRNKRPEYLHAKRNPKTRSKTA